MYPVQCVITTLLHECLQISDYLQGSHSILKHNQFSRAKTCENKLILINKEGSINPPKKQNEKLFALLFQILRTILMLKA